MSIQQTLSSCAQSSLPGLTALYINLGKWKTQKLWSLYRKDRLTVQNWYENFCGQKCPDDIFSFCWVPACKWSSSGNRVTIKAIIVCVGFDRFHYNIYIYIYLFFFFTSPVSCFNDTRSEALDITRFRSCHSTMVVVVAEKPAKYSTLLEVWMAPENPTPNISRLPGEIGAGNEHPTNFTILSPKFTALSAPWNPSRWSGTVHFFMQPVGSAGWDRP